MQDGSEVLGVYFTNYPSTNLLLMATNQLTYYYEVKTVIFIVVNLDNGNDIHSITYNYHIDFLDYSTVGDKIVIKSGKLVQLLDPISLKVLSQFSIKENCVNFGVLDQITGQSWVYCQFAKSFI